MVLAATGPDRIVRYRNETVRAMAVAARPEIRTVQALRAFACLAVIVYHAEDAWGARLAHPLAADAIWANGAAGVDLFFVISGFVMALSSVSLSGPAGAALFLRRRLRRIVPLYWMMSGAKLACLAAAGAALPTLWHLGASLLFLPSRDAAGLVRPVLGVGWTLQFEMLFYGLFALALAWRVAPWRLLLCALVPLAAAGFFRAPNWPAPLVLANGLVLEFCLGLAVGARLGRGRAVPPRRTAPLLCFFAAATILLLAAPQPGPWRFLFWGGPACAMLACAVALEARVGHHIPAGLVAVGEASYAIYLLHPFIVPALARLIAHLAGLHALVALAAISLVLSTLGGCMLHRCVDRPLQAWLAGRRRAAAASSFRPAAQLVQL